MEMEVRTNYKGLPDRIYQNTKECIWCHISKPEEDFKGTDKVCRLCRKLKGRKQRRKQYRQWTKFRLQFKCIHCGLKDTPLIDFHHKDASLKEREVSMQLYFASPALFYKELEKCIPLCVSCHKKFHILFGTTVNSHKWLLAPWLF